MGYGLGYGLRVRVWVTDCGLAWITRLLVHGARLERCSSSERKIPGSSPGVDEKKGKYKNILQSQVQWKKTCGSNGVFLDVAQW